MREAPLWTGIAPDLIDFFETLGLSAQEAFEGAFLVGLMAAVALVFGFYRLGVIGARSVGGGLSATQLAKAFAPSLVPIALAYVAAHYVTQLLYQGQAVVELSSSPFGYLASNPLGAQGPTCSGPRTSRSTTP